MNRLSLITFASAAALGVAACGDDAAEEDMGQEIAEDTVFLDAGPDTNVQLSPEQQQRLDALDREAVADEYTRNVDSLREGGASTETGTTNSTQSRSSTDQAGASTGSTGSGETGATGSEMPPRSQMDFAFLDRNGDGQLSVAEYAIWAIPANPNSPVPNDQTKPYITTEQINEAGQTFFYFDQDGSTYLSESEFTTARNSGRAP